MKILKETRMNTHQTHLEDLVLLGKDGLNELNDKIDKFLERFESQEKKLNLTQKIDGAPALFCWSKYPGYPDNSIALKGFTSGPQNALSSNEQIDAKYGDRPDMAEKLKSGLELARYIPAGECWQGDCLFSDSTKKEEEINGTNYITFMPNKIVYAFSENNADYDKVKNSDFGIAFHTIYKDSDGKMKQGFNVDPTRLNAPDNFYIMSPAINASTDRNDYNVDELKNQFEELKSLEQKLLNNPAYEELVNNSSFMNYWNTFENSSLADKKQVNINIDTFIDDLKDYVKNKQEQEYNKKLATLKTDKGRISAESTFNKNVEKLSNIIEDNKTVLIDLVNALNLAANIKMNMWSGLKQAKNDYSTYYKSRTKGYIPAEGEGIAMSDMDGNIVKIVDRSTFSSYNRDPDIMSGFEHESLDLHEDIDIDKLDIKLKPALEKFLGDKKKEFIETIVKMILDHTAYDYFNLGVYRDDMYPEDHLDANGKSIQAKLRKVHNFWLDKFGLDTSKRGVGSAIDSAITSIDWAIDDTDEYKDTLDWDDTKKLPEDEQFKIRLFYDWDVEVRKNFWGEYDDDDPITQMSFKEYLEYLLKEGNYSGHKRDLIKDMIDEIKDGHGYFEEHDVDEEMATQRSDMGSFNKPIFNKKKLILKEDSDKKTAVVAFGRFNPPTIGHRKLAEVMAEAASGTGEKAKFYLSHSVDSKKDPLSYDSKLNWCRKAVGDLVDVVESPAKTAWEVLGELYDQGYTDIIYAGGSDRIEKGKDNIFDKLVNFNGKQDNTGKVLYNFNSIEPLNAGSRNPDSSNTIEQTSASLVRKFVLNNDFNDFKKFVPFNDKDAYNLFKQLKYAMKGKEEDFLKECDLRINYLKSLNN